MNKACPVVLRDGPSGPEILAFQHPTSGKQIVKGTIEDGECFKDTCVRELMEEAGIAGAFCRDLGEWDAAYKGQVWGIALMSVVGEIPENFCHWCEDDGGHQFEFFWQSMNAHLDESWHPVYVRAIKHIKEAL